MRKLGKSFPPFLASKARAADLTISKRALTADGPSHHVYVLPDGTAYSVTATPREAERFFERHGKRVVGAFRPLLAKSDPIVTTREAVEVLLDALEMVTLSLAHRNAAEDAHEEEFYRLNPHRRRPPNNTNS